MLEWEAVTNNSSLRFDLSSMSHQCSLKIVLTDPTMTFWTWASGAGYIPNVSIM